MSNGIWPKSWEGGLSPLLHWPCIDGHFEFNYFLIGLGSNIWNVLFIITSFSKFLDLLSPNSSKTQDKPDRSKHQMSQVLDKVLNTGSQGIIKIYTGILSQKTLYSSFLVSTKTTCNEVILMVLDKFNMKEEFENFYLCQVSDTGKGTFGSTLRIITGPRPVLSS